ncbi:MAG TPA: hypothetical protein VNO54_16830 [Streptosporangiaceae bacterium]|nr:hypothetical protein [Streptosporangiaceae bacterium]
MRRILFLSLALVAVLGFVAPPDVSAQAAAPAPKFTITGLIDNVGTFTQNLSSSDLNLNRNRDHQMYGRTRGRFDIIGEVGQAKGVFGFEIDSYWGQTGFIDSNNGPGCVTSGANSAVTCGAVGAGAESSFDLNTDTQGNFQIKWLYTEFPLPLIPFSTIVRLGGQPFATAASFKLATYANGDFPGVNLYTTFSPTFKWQTTYVAIDENLLGKGAFGPILAGGSTQLNKCISAGGAVATGCTPQSRGDNFAMIMSPEITVMKGLDIKPMFSHMQVTGLTSGAARTPRAGVVTAAGGPFAPLATVAGADGAGTGIHESRNTIGLDARWRMGPWSLDPTWLWQFGSQQKWNLGGVATAYGNTNQKYTADINAWLGDLRVSYQLGPLLLSAMTMFTTGQDAKSNPYKSIKYFQPLDTDTSYMADWGTQIMSLGVDYYQILGVSVASGGANPGTAIGWDKYGRVSAGVKASYAITPALTVGAGVTPNWTWNKVDTDAYIVTGGGLQPSFICRKTLRTCRPEGDSNFLGTEFNAALTYRFAPGLTFDWAIGYMMTDLALQHRYVVGADYNVQAPVRKDIGVNDIILTTARVRFSF